MSKRKKSAAPAAEELPRMTPVSHTVPVRVEHNDNLYLCNFIGTAEEKDRKVATFNHIVSGGLQINLEGTPGSFVFGLLDLCTAAKTARDLEEAVGMAGRLAEAKVSDSALDEEVHDMASAIASDVNNGGHESQVRYLIQHGGLINARMTVSAVIQAAARRK